MYIPNFINELKEDSNDSSEIFGVVGLYNMGNSCYINTIIALLSNTQPLTDYFLMDLHKKEMVLNNPLGSKGEITD